MLEPQTTKGEKRDRLKKWREIMQNNDLQQQDKKCALSPQRPPPGHVSYWVTGGPQHVSDTKFRLDILRQLVRITLIANDRAKSKFGQSDLGSWREEVLVRANNSWTLSERTPQLT